MGKWKLPDKIKSTLPWPPHQMAVSGQHHDPAVLPHPPSNQAIVPIGQEAGWAKWLVLFLLGEDRVRL